MAADTRLTNTQQWEALYTYKHAIALYSTQDIILEMANDAMLAFWGRDRSIIGLPLDVALPEIKDQPFVSMMREVLNTGIDNIGKAIRADLEVNGTLQTFYFDYEYRAIKNAAGETYCVMHTAEDVTEEVLGKEAIRVSQERQVALEREKALNEELASANEELNAINEELKETQLRLSDLNNELEERVLSRTKALVLSEAKAYSLNEELATTNKDLVSLNEELASSNEEMLASNEELISTNEELNDTQRILSTTVSQLELSQSRFQNLVREANIGIIVLVGEDLRVEIVNKTYGKLIERSVNELLGQKLFDIIPEAEASFRPVITNVLLTGETLYLYDVPYLVYNNGNKIEGFLNLVYQPYIDDDQSITGVIVLCQDVTEQVHAKFKLESAYDQLRLSKEAAQLGFFDLDLVNVTLEWDDRCRLLFGISHKDVITYEKDFINGLHIEDRERILSIINTAFNKSVSNGVYDVEYRTVGAEDEQLRWVRAKGQVYFDDKDTPVRFIGSVLEITEQKEDEQRKNDFIGMVSHELKTPLTSMKGYLQLLKSKAQKNQDVFTANVLEKSNNQINKMTTLINGFLNVSRLESGKIYIDKQVFNIVNLLKEIEEEFIATASSHHIVFGSVSETIIYADRDKIGQVINNLLSNAVKYSPAGSTIKVACVTADNKAMVTVQDEGMGIDPKDIDRLFERYYRVDSNNMTAISGFGIGLYLSSEIIERHDGTIGVDSLLGKGSTFWFTLPVSQA